MKYNCIHLESEHTIDVLIIFLLHFLIRLSTPLAACVQVQVILLHDAQLVELSLCGILHVLALVVMRDGCMKFGS